MSAPQVSNFILLLEKNIINSERSIIQVTTSELYERLIQNSSNIEARNPSFVLKAKSLQREGVRQSHPIACLLYFMLPPCSSL